MRGRWRLAACAAVVLLVHAGLMAGWWRLDVSGARRPPPHRVATLRLVVLGAMADPVADSPGPRSSTEAGVQATTGTAAPASPVPAAIPQPYAVAARPALAPERVASAAPSPSRQTLAPPREFLSPAEVDRVAIAFPSPDMSRLAGLNWSGLPVRLRLFVDAGGQCVDVQVLRASENVETLEGLRQMFLATHFLPARKAGADIASYRDIELDVSDVK